MTFQSQGLCTCCFLCLESGFPPVFSFSPKSFSSLSLSLEFNLQGGTSCAFLSKVGSTPPSISFTLHSVSWTCFFLSSFPSFKQHRDFPGSLEAKTLHTPNAGDLAWSLVREVKSESVVAQSCLALCNPMGWSLLGSSVHGILQARILEWVAIPFSRVSPQPSNQPRSPTLQTDSLLSEPPGKSLLVRELDPKCHN